MPKCFICQPGPHPENYICPFCEAEIEKARKQAMATPNKVIRQRSKKSQHDGIITAMLAILFILSFLSFFNFEPRHTPAPSLGVLSLHASPYKF